MMSSNKKQWETTTTKHEGFNPQNENSTLLVYAVYETTNTITQETYAGVYSYKAGTAIGEYKNEKYIGQGITYDGQAELMKPTAFTKNVAAYGYDAFSKKILYITLSEDDAYAKEAEIVDEAYVDKSTTLNQRQGGRYGKIGKASKKRRSIASMGGKNNNAKKVLDKETGKVYGSIKDASKKLKMNYRTLITQMNKGLHTNLIRL